MVISSAYSNLTRLKLTLSWQAL